METSRSKQFIGFKAHTVLSSVRKSRAISREAPRPRAHAAHAPWRQSFLSSHLGCQVHCGGVAVLVSKEPSERASTAPQCPRQPPRPVSSPHASPAPPHVITRRVSTVQSDILRERDHGYITLITTYCYNCSIICYC